LAVAAALWAAGLVGADRQNRRTLALGLLAVSSLEVLYGANLWIARSTRIWGIEVGGSPSRLRGTYINPDHLAFLLAIVTTCCFAWIWWALRRAMRHGPIEQRLLHTLLPGLFFLLFFAGLIFTGSRAGLVAITAAIVLQGACLMMFHRRWHVVATAGGAIVLCGLAVSWFGFQGGLGRLLSTSAYEVTWNHRIKVYAASLELWQEFPLLGTGLGTFRQAFPRVQPAGLDNTWNHAHSDFLEILVTNGVIGLVLACLGVVLVGRHLWRLYRRGERSEDRATGLAVFGALLATAFHSAVDFGLTMPANSMILAIVVGAALAATPRPTPPPQGAARPVQAPPRGSIDELDGPQRGDLTGQGHHLQKMWPRFDGER
jgi:O-antigen ligase